MLDHNIDGRWSYWFEQTQSFYHSFKFAQNCIRSQIRQQCETGKRQVNNPRFGGSSPFFILCHYRSKSQDFINHYIYPHSTTAENVVNNPSILETALTDVKDIAKGVINTVKDMVAPTNPTNIVQDIDIGIQGAEQTYEEITGDMTTVETQATTPIESPPTEEPTPSNNPPNQSPEQEA